MATLRCRILEFINDDMLLALNKICKDRFESNNNKKADKIIDIIKANNVEYQELGVGTNRLALLIDGYVFKFALDKLGIQDNWAEFSLAQELQPFVTKVYECNGIISVSEYVTVISKDEFNEVKPQLREILRNIADRYLLGDVGTIPKNFMNWGYRDNNDLVILDFGYIYRLQGQEMICTNTDNNGDTCGNFLEYDENFHYLRCSKCGSKYPFNEIRFRIDPQYEKKEVAAIKSVATKMTEPIMEIADNDEPIECPLYTTEDECYDYIYNLERGTTERMRLEYENRNKTFDYDANFEKELEFIRSYQSKEEQKEPQNDKPKVENHLKINMAAVDNLVNGYTSTGEIPKPISYEEYENEFMSTMEDNYNIHQSEQKVSEQAEPVKKKKDKSKKVKEGTGITEGKPFSLSSSPKSKSEADLVVSERSKMEVEADKDRESKMEVDSYDEESKLEVGSSIMVAECLDQQNSDEEPEMEAGFADNEFELLNGIEFIDPDEIEIVYADECISDIDDDNKADPSECSKMEVDMDGDRESKMEVDSYIIEPKMEVGSVSKQSGIVILEPDLKKEDSKEVESNSDIIRIDLTSKSETKVRNKDTKDVSKNKGSTIKIIAPSSDNDSDIDDLREQLRNCDYDEPDDIYEELYEENVRELNSIKYRNSSYDRDR